MKKIVTLIILLLIIMGKGYFAELRQNEWPPSHYRAKFLPIINIVNLTENNLSTEYNFLAAIPIAVYHYNNVVYQSLLIPDKIEEKTIGYILDDWMTYLDYWEGIKKINFIGNISLDKKLQIKNLCNISWEYIYNVTGNPINIANELANSNWIYSDEVIITTYIENLSNEDVEIVSNAAVIASLLNAPLLYSKPHIIHQDTLNTITSLKAKKAILIGNFSQNVTNKLQNLSIEEYKDRNSIVSKIINITGKSMLCAIILNWQNLPASLYAARYGGYVLFLPETIVNMANEAMEKLGNMSDRKLEKPIFYSFDEEEIAQEFYEWLEGIGASDPDNLEIVVTFNTAPYYDPANGFSVIFERAITGDPSNLSKPGAITARMPLNFLENIALVNRGATYRATIFANPRPNHITLCMNAYEVQHEVDEGWPIVDSWGTNHIVNEIFGWPYRGWCEENNYFPWNDIHNNTPNLSPILPPGDGDGPDCDPGTFATFLGYEAHFHSGAYAGNGSHPSQPSVANIGFVADVENGSAFLYFSCHGGGTSIRVAYTDNGIYEDNEFGEPYWPAPDGRVNYVPGTYTEDDMDNDFENTHGLIIGYNACSMANGKMNEILLKHGGTMSIASYTSVSFTGSGWWWNLFTYLITFENYSLGEAATYATARTSPIYTGDIYRDVDYTLHYVCYGDPMVKFVKPTWNIPKPVEINFDYGGHVPGEIEIFEYFVSKGWNLITIPCKCNLTASSLGNLIPNCSIIIKWNATLQQFQSYLVGISPPEYDFEIKQGIGYFVYVNNDTTFSIIGLPISNVSVPLHIGWNLIGWFKNETTTASLLGQNITNCSIISKWNASLQQYQSYLVGISPPEYDFAIKQGMGIFIYTNEESIWHG